jgi:hypothetical protein
MAQNKPQELTTLLTSSGPELLQGLVSVFNQKADGADAKSINDNKRIAVFTTALMAKNFRDAMNGEIQKVNQTQGQNIPPVAITDLPAINELVMKIRPESEPSPEVRSAAIQALSFLTQPEDSATVGELLNAVIGDEKDPQKKGDPDASVITVAKEALAALPPAPVAAAPVAEATPAVAAPAAPVAEAPVAQPKAA